MSSAAARVLIALSLLYTAACAQLTGKTSTPSAGEEVESEVGKATKADANGFLDMPFLTTMSEGDARATLLQSGITGNVKVEYVECFDKSVTTGHVCNTYPAGGAQTTTTSDTTLFVTK